MEIRDELYQDRHITRVEGLIKRSDFHLIQEAIKETPAATQQEVWIDCTHVQNINLTNFCFSDFISKLLELHTNNIKVLLFGVDTSTRTMLQLLKLDNVFKQVDNLEEAYLSLSVESKESVQQTA